WTLISSACVSQLIHASPSRSADQERFRRRGTHETHQSANCYFRRRQRFLARWGDILMFKKPLRIAIGVGIAAALLAWFLTHRCGGAGFCFDTCCSGKCVKTASDAANCGTCRTLCSGGQTCSSGACSCPAGTTLCSGTCVNVSSSSTNCGACGNKCPADQ